MSEKIAIVYRTNNYSKFRRLNGNRSVQQARVQKIIGSIKKVGYVMSPIIVNQSYEVIDGQGRLEALKQLGLPVDYIVVKDIGVNECIAMNLIQTNWALSDFIDSYAERGAVPYVYMQQLIKRFGKKFSLKVINNAVTGKDEVSAKAIKNGELNCDAHDYENAIEILNYLLDYREMIKRVDGHIEFYYMALAFCYRDQAVNNARMLQNFTRLQANLYPVVNIFQALEVVEEIYNNRTREKVYIKTNYRQYLEGKYPWYRKKYADKWEVVSDEKVR